MSAILIWNLYKDSSNVSSQFHIMKYMFLKQSAEFFGSYENCDFDANSMFIYLASFEYTIAVFFEKKTLLQMFPYGVKLP